MERNQTYKDAAEDNGAFGQETSGKRASRAERGSGHGLFLAGLITGIGGALLIVAIVYLGFGLQNFTEKLQGGSREALSTETDSVASEDMVSKVKALEKAIDRYYYLEEVSDEELRTGLYKGMMEALGDPYSEYYSAEELDTFLQDTEGLYYGIGAYMMLDTQTGLPMITDVMPGAPAEAAGLRSNDIIYEVDGVSVYGMSLDEAISLIKGPEATDVVLTVVRESESDYLEVTVTRAQVEAPTVTVEMLEDGMAYIEVSEFDTVTVDQFADALATARGKHMKGLILDLRGNPGGSLDAVVEMCRMLLPKGMIVYTEDKNGQRDEYTCDGAHRLEVPLVVLVDGNSASASEIMAGAIKDYGIGTLVGTTTFGKGIVQQIVPFRDGSAIKITTSAYYTPKGNNIHGTGISPDVECPFDGEAYYGSEDHPDNQLEKAKEVLADLIGG